MEKSELRENNWVLYPNLVIGPLNLNPKGMGQIKSRNGDSITIIDDINKGLSNYTGVYPVDFIDPIELTKSILLNNGFKPINNEPLFGIPPGETFYRILYQIDNHNCPLILKEKDKVLCHVVPSDGFYGCALNPIKYTHQLQNLYFILSGKELGVKL